MADAATAKLAQLKALQQLRLAQSRAELGKQMAQLATTEERLVAENVQLRSDETALQAVLAADHFNTDELRLTSLVAERQRRITAMTEGARDEKLTLEGEARQAAAACEVQAEHLNAAHREATRRWAEKSDAKQAAEIISLAVTQSRRNHR